MFDMSASTMFRLNPSGLGGRGRAAVLNYFYLRPGGFSPDGVVPPTNWSQNLAVRSGRLSPIRRVRFNRTKSGAPACTICTFYDVTQAESELVQPAVRENSYKVVNSWYDRGVRRVPLRRY